MLILLLYQNNNSEVSNQVTTIVVSNKMSLLNLRDDKTQANARIQALGKLQVFIADTASFRIKQIYYTFLSIIIQLFVQSLGWCRAP